MAGLFGAAANSQKPTQYTALNLQTSAQGVCIPIGWGKFRATTNVLWYNNFIATAQKQKAGKGGGSGTVTGYNYSVAIILGLCEGPVASIGQVWASRAVTTLAALNLTLFTGTTVQTPAAWIVSNYPAEAQSYPGTAYVFSSLYALGSSPDLPAHNFEVVGALSGTMPYGSLVDANPADIIEDFLTNTQYAMGFPSSALDATSLAFFKTYCQAQGLFLSPYLHTQEQVTSTLQRWAQLANTWIFWSGDVLKFVPLGDSDIAAHSATYTAVTSARYALTLDDFDPNGDAPVEVTRADPADAYNHVQIDVSDRANQYNSAPIHWEDQAAVDAAGSQLQAVTIAAPEVCDLSIAQMMAALIGQRSVNIRNTYRFKLPTTFVLLEPGDIVTLTEPNIGLAAVAVRIRTIDEADTENQILAVVAEEFPAGANTQAAVGTLPYFPNAPQPTAASAPPNILVDPGDVNPPGIFEPSPLLTGGNPEVWIALSGGADWGGADIYLSFDGGSTYSLIGTQTAPAVQGVLTSGLASHADPDTTNTLHIDLAASASILPTTAAHADADAGRTLCLIGSEVLAYGTVANGATATKFNLTYLRRGQYGTSPAAHSTSDQFTRYDPATTFVYALPLAYVGATLHLKFVSFNVFGQVRQDISAVTDYTYTPVGTAFTIAAPTSPSLSANSFLQTDGTRLIGVTLTWTASAGPLLDHYEVQLSQDGGSTFPYNFVAGAGALAYNLLTFANTSCQARVRAVSQGGLATSAWATSGTVTTGTISGTTITASFAAGLTATGTNQGTALALAALENVFSTVASGTGAILPVVNVGTSITVINDGANALLVYPNSGGAIAGGSTNAAVTVVVGGIATFRCTASNTWNAR